MIIPVGISALPPLDTKYHKSIIIKGWMQKQEVISKTFLKLYLWNDTINEKLVENAIQSFI